MESKFRLSLGIIYKEYFGEDPKNKKTYLPTMNPSFLTRAIAPKVNNYQKEFSITLLMV